MSISIDTEKAFDKIQHTFIIKIPQQIGYRRNIPQPIYDQRTINIILNGESLKTFRYKTRLSSPTALIQHSIESPS